MNTEEIPPEALTPKQRCIREQVEWFRALAAEGKTVAEAASLMGLSRNIAYLRAARGGFSYRSSCLEVPAERLHELAQAGKTLMVTSEELGLSYSRVRFLSKKLGIPFKDGREGSHRRVTEPGPREMEMIEARNHGERLEAIGQRYGITRERVRQICKKFGAASSAALADLQRIDWCCVVCGNVQRMAASRAREKSKWCSKACRLTLHAKEWGWVIKRRIAGERWQDISESYCGNRNSYDNLRRHARIYLQHIGAPSETWAIVFPGKGLVDDLSRARQSAAQVARFARERAA